MDAAEQLFLRFLKERRLKVTSERRAILRTVANFGRPFEAEELLLRLRAGGEGGGGEGGGGSKATVYRTLKHLLDAGLLKQIHFGAGAQAHYDFVPAGQASHDHLLDLDTGKVIPFSNPALVELRDRIARELGFEAVSHRFQIIARKQG
jgi:Fur family ferric uptake transcriptional regulator